MSLQSDNTRLIGNLVVKSAHDTTSIEVAYLNAETLQLTMAIVEKDENKILDLQAKYERVLEAYNKEF